MYAINQLTGLPPWHSPTLTLPWQSDMGGIHLKSLQYNVQLKPSELNKPGSAWLLLVTCRSLPLILQVCCLTVVGWSSCLRCCVQQPACENFVVLVESEVQAYTYFYTLADIWLLWLCGLALQVGSGWTKAVMLRHHILRCDRKPVLGVPYTNNW